MTPTSSRNRGCLRGLLIAAALFGAAVSVFLQAASLAGRAGALFSLACGAGGRFDCGSALSSRWGQIGPLPTATWGLAYFSFLSLWYIVAGLPNWKGRWRHLIPLGATFAGAIASLAFSFLLFFRLPAICPWCLVAHALNFLLLIGAVMAWPRGGTSVVEAARPSWARVGGVVGISVAWGLAAAATVAAWYYYLAAAAARGALLEAVNNPEYLVWRNESARKVDVGVRPDDFAVGTVTAPHTLAVFMDFECPHCREFEAFVPDLVRKYRGRLRVVFKHYPMSRACSDELPVGQDVHRYSCEASRAAETARRTGTPQQAWEYRKLLFANIDRFGARPWVELAAKVGLDAERFRKAFDDPATAAWVAADVATARALEVEGAGALFLDGRRLPTYRVTTWDVSPQTDDVQTWRMWDRLLPELFAPASGN